MLGHDPGHAGALHLLGVLTCQTGRTRTAIDLIGRAIAINPAVAEYHNDLGESYRRAGELDAAIACFQRAIALKPGAAMTHNNLGNALLAQGRADLAIAAYRRAIALKGDVAEFHANLGIALHGTGQREAAIAAYRSALALAPEDSRVHSNLASPSRKSAGPTRHSPPSTAPSHSRTMTPASIATAALPCSRLGRLDEAIAACNRALALEPDHAEAHYNLGCAWRLKGDLDQAIAALSRAIAAQARPRPCPQ